MKFNLYLVRHGETYLNKYEKMQEWSDSPLTIEGKRDLKKLQEKLKHISFDNILMSDSGRTIESVSVFIEGIPEFESINQKKFKEF